jgi:hypothetical protein
MDNSANNTDNQTSDTSKDPISMADAPNIATGPVIQTESADPVDMGSNQSSLNDSMSDKSSDAETTPPDPIETSPTPSFIPREEEPLIDLPKPKPALESTADDGRVATPPTTTTPTPSVTTTTTSEEPKPASLPEKPIVGDYLHSKNKPAIIAITSVVLLVITAGLAFLYVQNNRLKGQIRTIEDINSQRNLPPLSPTATPSGMAEANPYTVFSDLDAVVTKAQAESTSAQLLMITVDNLSLKDNKAATYNYWFRTGPGTGEYFQIAKPSAGEYQLIKPATVNPDNNIPDLLESKKANTLGIDDQQVIKLGWEKVASQFSQGNEPQRIGLIYIIANPSNPAITTPVNLWQVTYFFPKEAGVEDVIIQVDANNQNVVFTNKNITVPTNEVTPSEPTPTSQGS